MVVPHFQNETKFQMVSFNIFKCHLALTALDQFYLAGPFGLLG